MNAAGIDRFVLDNVPERCTLRSAVLEHTARRRGFDVDRIRRSVVIVWMDGAAVAFRGLNGPDSSLVGQLSCTYRDAQRRLLGSRGIPVPTSKTYAGDQPRTALRFAMDMPGLTSVLPARVAGTAGSTRDVADEDGFRRAWRRAVRAYETGSAGTPVLVEEQPEGSHLQFFVVDDNVVAVSERSPASVTGDGTTSIGALIREKNAERAQNPVLRDNPIPDRFNSLRALRRAGRDLGHVPEDGEHVLLRFRVDTLTGVDVIDVTDEVHPRLKMLAVDAMRVVPGVPYGSVDMVVENMTEPGTGSRPGVVTHVNGAPVPIAQFPSQGQQRDIAAAIVDHYLKAPRWKLNRQPRPDLRPRSADRQEYMEPLFRPRGASDS